MDRRAAMGIGLVGLLLADELGPGLGADHPEAVDAAREVADADTGR